jgi:hypothetical protein
MYGKLLKGFSAVPISADITPHLLPRSVNRFTRLTQSIKLLADGQAELDVMGVALMTCTLLYAIIICNAMAASLDRSLATRKGRR